MSGRISVLAVAAVAIAASVAGSAARAGQGGGAETAFEGAWSATGRRQTLPTEDGGTAAIVQLSGPVAVTAGEGLGRGFHGELIGFDDGRRMPAGRWVWTDQRGDRLFGEIAGDGMRTGHRFTGTITGGSGRYAGATGSFGFTWQYVVAAEDGVVQGRTTDLKGRFQRGRP
jgi:hypothetical protein